MGPIKITGLNIHTMQLFIPSNVTFNFMWRSSGSSSAERSRFRLIGTTLKQHLPELLFKTGTMPPWAVFVLASGLSVSLGPL